MLKLGFKKLLGTSKPHITTTMIKELSMILTGLKTKSSLMLPPDLDSQFLEKNLLKEFSDLRDPWLILVTNSSHSYKPLQWSQMLTSTFKKETLFTKMQKLLNGSNSGKHLPLCSSECLQVSTCLKYIKVTELHLFSGWRIIGIGSIFLVSSKMAVDGTLMALDIVTITTI